jgi:hypothetical protein
MQCVVTCNVKVECPSFILVGAEHPHTLSSKNGYFFNLAKLTNQLLEIFPKIVGI